VTYASLFPFARGEDDVEDRLAPDAVTDFIEQEFMPIIEQTWYTQLEEWGFGRPLHPDWDADKVIEVNVTSRPFALFDGTGTYTVYLDAEGRPNPERRIWWLSTHNALERYDSLVNGYRALFAHEFFHLAQWNHLLAEGTALTEGDENAGLLADYWTNTFVEAQAEFAASAQYPELELERSHLAADNSAYSSSANRFLAYRLNTSYRELEADATSKYDLALYWRFLYEQYGDMRVIRAALEEMLHHHESDIVGSMQGAVDAAFARLDGPFSTFEESVIAFARASFALRLENGRCAAQDPAGCEGFLFDPERVYVRPRLEANLYYRGTALTYDDAISSSYGMDFIKVHLDPAMQGEPLLVRLEREGDGVRFNLQVWKLRRGDLEPRAVTAQPEIVQLSAYGDGAHAYLIASVDTTVYDQLGLIITRVDPHEATAPLGEYRIIVMSAEGAVGGDAGT
jgi:hypothetical protein